MKELSIEEKAKRYDKLFVKASRIYNKENDVLILHTIEDLFPELQEPEDERIKKTLINFFSKGAEYDSSTNGIKDRNIIAWLEKQGKGKLTDKPKFKVGDWITDDEAIFHITSYDIDYGYQLETVNGTSFHYSDETLEKYRLWTIQDAKDGDVLSYQGEMFILKDLELFHTLTYYCCYDGKRFITNSLYALVTGDFDNIKPATKEQRDLLFQKMHEAGYEWDAEKKELRKIDARKNITLDGDLMEADCMIVEQEPAWSEEDECYMGECISAIATKDSWSFEEKRKTKHWLKSLKDRYTWKPSIAQLNALSIVSKGNAPDDIEAIVSLYNDLKKLREE